MTATSSLSFSATTLIALIATPVAADSSLETTVIYPAEATPEIAASYTPESGQTPKTPSYSASLLDSIGHEFALPYESRPRTDQQLRWFVSNPDYLQRVFERSRRYMPHIVEEIRKRNLPMEFALLPVVESAYDPFAYSHGRAAGLWQFIPGTGRLFKLEQNWWYDGRRDPVASTRAALDYLEHLHARLDGDWLLAIAAYNSGEGRVRGAIRKNRRKGLPTDFWHLALPRETRAYVPKLLALSELVKNSWRYDVQLPVVSGVPYFREVSTGGQIDLALVASLANIEVQEIYKLNAGLNRWATAPSGPHRLMVPYDVAYALQEKLDQLPATERISWKRHKIKSGDALSTIASKYGTTVRALQQANSLRGTSIRAGRYLMIPIARGNASQYALSVDMREQRLLNSAAPGEGVQYTVRHGDSFWSIATQHGVSTRRLAKWNGMAPGDTLPVGKTLLIKQSQGATAAAPATSPDGTRRKIRYTVRRGDSLSKISSRFRVSVSDLQKWNRIKGQKYLQPGQKLNLYVDVTRQSGG
ncbi:MAG: LysM peptidoglycan-binding domain-containing protein [Gammaproteobacteria bacterium]|nr:LysM peptidoglycan-binding domain-containing protein [Gammaproteobacteria bacterium]